MTNLKTIHPSDILAFRFHDIILVDCGDCIQTDVTEAFDEIMSAAFAYRDSEPQTHEDVNNHHILVADKIRRMILSLRENLNKELETIHTLKTLEAEQRINGRR